MNMRKTARAIRVVHPLAGRACPHLLSAGRFTMTPERLRRGDLGHRQTSSVTWVLEMFTHGQMHVDIDQQLARDVGPGWGSLYAPGTRYREIVPPGQQCQSVVVYFHPAGSDVLKRLTQLSPSYRFIHDAQGRLLKLAQEIEQRLAGQDADQLAAMGAFMQAMSILTAAEDSDATLIIDSAAADDLVSITRRFMRQHLQQPIGVADLAKHAGLSESGFAHAYRKLAGQSPMQELRRARVDAVKKQLLHNRLRLASIAEITGFSDAFHLSHVFRKVTGMSPRQFKKASAQGLPPGEVTQP